jgi:coenzyme F420-0:L-glutamate ligase / coenzyme F420-1:gamma-L-glutamate ligase
VRETLQILPVEGLPEIGPGAPLGDLIAERADLRDDDVVVISQKAVSKAEGRVRHLAEVAPSAEARDLAKLLDKDPRLVELVLAESRRVVRAERGVLITETRHGFVCANAGIDSSNLPEVETVCLLPEDPDASARAIRAELRPIARVAVVLSDSFGRAWRLGQADVAIGCAGLAPLEDWRGLRDSSGRELRATVVATADEVAAAADLVRDKTAGVPAVVVRGLGGRVTEENGPGAAALRRPAGEDLFR